MTRRQFCATCDRYRESPHRCPNQAWAWPYFAAVFLLAVVGGLWVAL